MSLASGVSVAEPEGNDPAEPTVTITFSPSLSTLRRPWSICSDKAIFNSSSALAASFSAALESPPVPSPSPSEVPPPACLDAASLAAAASLVNSPSRPPNNTSVSDLPAAALAFSRAFKVS